MYMLTRTDWLWLALLASMGGAILLLLLFGATGCGDDDSAACPDSLAATSAHWSPAAGQRAQCADLADALNENGVNVAGDDDSGTGECTGHSSQSQSGGACHATITSTCEDGLAFALDCAVRRDRTADCDVRIDSPDLEDTCRLRVLLR